ncbi:hypothetical protein H6G36_21135 [Anabaena minutissima FACHB-250]|nr:hypothetical protein [Anabaena minutissima FACHB-250]
MKKILSLILVIGMIPAGSFFFTSKRASAFCVYNKTSDSISGSDTRRTAQFGEKHWRKDLNPGQRDCCPGNNSECQGATIFIVNNSGQSCKVKVGAHQALVVSKRRNQLICRVN